MNNAEKFKQIFGLYATELWSMPESDFLEWLNRDVETTQIDHNADINKKVSISDNHENDCISRQAAIDACTDRFGVCIKKEALEALPPAQPERKKGHWFIDSDGCYPYCSECRTEPSSGHMTDFCPNCGADMRPKEGDT